MGGESIGESLLARLLLVSVSPSHPPRPPDTGSPKGALSQLEDSLRALLTEDRANASEARLWLSTGASWLEVLGAPVTRDPLLRLLPGRWTTEPQLKRGEPPAPPFLTARAACMRSPRSLVPLTWPASWRPPIPMLTMLVFVPTAMPILM
mmetsp:Transcript_28045/g.70543  ORF Transcript_28045/g.70543 Transcript_28045/m.70543 type:complete len:150 (+) Transcript_28045:126-575(+)